MRRSPSAIVAALITLVALLVLVQYVRPWAAFTPAEQRTGDFAGTYAAATLWRNGHAAAMYDLPAEEAVLAATGSPRNHLDIPYENPPAAAVLASPLTLLDAGTAYRVWDLLQLAMLVLAVVLATRVAPWPRSANLAVRVACSAVAVAGFATGLLFVEGQWDGPAVLGLAVAYAGWRRGRSLGPGFALGLCAAIAKPHLVFGLLAFMAGRRDWRGLLGAAAGATASMVVALATVGTTGVGAFIQALLQPSNSPVPLMQSALGFSESWFGASTATFAAGILLSAAALALAVLLGRRSRRDPTIFEPALLAATALSLLGAPHLLGHDLTLLAPVLVAALAWQARQEAGRAWPGPGSIVLIGCFVLLSLAAQHDVATASSTPAGRMTPIALALLVAVCAAALWLRPAHEPHPAPLRAGRAVLGDDADAAV